MKFIPFNYDEGDENKLGFSLTFNQQEIEDLSAILSYVAGSRVVYDFLSEAHDYYSEDEYKRVSFEKDEFGMPMLRLNEEKQEVEYKSSCGKCEECECDKVQYKYSEGNAFDPANMEIK
ncbi:hypothetical protein D3C86_1210970 [compost metagenome]